MTHLVIHHPPHASRSVPRTPIGALRMTMTVLALVVSIAMLRRLELALNPSTRVAVPTVTQSSPTPGFGD